MRFRTAAFAALFAMSVLPSVSAPAAPSASEGATLFAQAVSRGLRKDGLLLVVDASLQRAFLFSSNGPVADYPVSTAAAGLGNRTGSQRTPTGWHEVQERFGADAPLGTVFVSRQPDGRVLLPEQWSDPAPKEDFVLSRILWLRGLEKGVNRGKGIDSHARCIYIHGTNQEQLLGSPASHGCIRMSNRDIRALFDLSDRIPTYCLIR